MPRRSQNDYYDLNNNEPMKWMLEPRLVMAPPMVRKPLMHPTKKSIHSS